MADVDDLLTERLLRVIDEGRRTATYKLALLIALIDAVAIAPGEAEVPTRAIAQHVLALYYPQTRVYVAAGGIERELRQISMKSSPVLQSALRLRVQGESEGCRTLAEVARKLPRAYAEAVGAVEDTFVRYPIPLLQIVGSQLRPFLYEAEWGEGTTAASLRARHLDRIRLLPGVADRLVVLGPLLRPLIELTWTRDVARWSGVSIEEETLRDHLFGVRRVSFPRPFVAALRELQAGSCFYCGTQLKNRVEVDHFIAWSRWPNDSIENLVVADACNGAKSDHVAAEGHLQRWLQRDAMRADLAEIAAQHRWDSNPERTDALVRTTYGYLAAGTPLWVHGKHFVEAAGPLIAR